MTRGQRQQSGPPVTSVPTLSSHQVTAVTIKVDRLLTLSRDAHEELDFRDFGNSRRQRSESKYASNVGRTLPVVPSQYLSRVPLGHPTLTLRTTVARSPKPTTSGAPRITSRYLTPEVTRQIRVRGERERCLLCTVPVVVVT